MKSLKFITLLLSFFFFVSLGNSHAQDFTILSLDNSNCGSSQMLGYAEGTLEDGYHFSFFVERNDGTNWVFYNAALELQSGDGVIGGDDYAYIIYEIPDAGTYRVNGRQVQKLFPPIAPTALNPPGGVMLAGNNPPAADFTLNGSNSLGTLFSDGNGIFTLDMDASMTVGPVDNYVIRVIEVTDECGHIPGYYFSNSFSGTGHPPGSFDMMDLITNAPNCARPWPKHYKVTVLIDGPCHQGWISHEDCITLVYMGPPCLTGDGESALQAANTTNTQQHLLDKVMTYPNPVVNNATISFEIGAASAVELSLYDTRGTLVTSVLNQQILDKGTHTYQFEMTDLPSGVYVYRLHENGQTRTGKLLKN